MKLELNRIVESGQSTIGELSVDGAFECYTLEDVVRQLGPNGEGKVWGKTAIPAGTYKITNSWSPKFGRMMPRLADVPFFTGILIHKGNVAENTHGCILVGRRFGDNYLHESTAAFEALYKKIADATTAGDEITITVNDRFREGA